MKNIDTSYLFEYKESIGKKIPKLIDKYQFQDKILKFDYLTNASAVYSSNIEGNSIDLNSFMNYKLSNSQQLLQKDIKQIEDLISAYYFAQNNSLNESNMLKCHSILSENLLIKSKRGKYRQEPVGVFDDTGLVYLAIESEFVQKAMSELFLDIQEIIESELDIVDSFYYASMIHLKLAHLHPFMDGNGRIARIIEKWFLAQKLGNIFWLVGSEKYYKENLGNYYKNINLGANYYELNYNNCINFLEMLPKSMEI